MRFWLSEGKICYRPTGQCGNPPVEVNNAFALNEQPECAALDPNCSDLHFLLQRTLASMERSHYMAGGERGTVLLSCSPSGNIHTEFHQQAGVGSEFAGVKILPSLADPTPGYCLVPISKRKNYERS